MENKLVLLLIRSAIFQLIFFSFDTQVMQMHMCIFAEKMHFYNFVCMG